MKTFMELYLTEKVSKDDINCFIEKWHDDLNCELDISCYLGMSEKMYTLFVETPKEFFERYTPNPPTLIGKR